MQALFNRKPIWVAACSSLYLIGTSLIALGASEDPIPYYPVDWNQNVQEWWAQHPYNSSSAKHFIDPPQTEPRIDVSVVRATHSESTTAGIEEALELLPPTGGTLWFPKTGSPYVLTKDLQKQPNLTQLGATALILRRSNLNFVSDGAEIRCPKIAFAFSSMEYADSNTFNKPVSNLYFKNLVFDGGQIASCAIIFNHVRNVLIDNCTFRNYTDAQEDLGKVNLGVVRAETKSEAIWLRQCEFNSGFAGLYLRGVHGGGAVDCIFKIKLGINLLTQDEMVKNMEHQATCQYIVIANSTFNVDSGISVLGSNCLITGNKAQSCQEFVALRAHWMPTFQYTYYGNQIVDNTINQANVFLKIETLDAVPSQLCELSNGTVRGNKIESAQYAVVADPKPDTIIRNIEITENSFSGKIVPQIQVLHAGVADIRIANNNFFGEINEILVPPTDESLPENAVIFEKNRINNVLKH